MSSSGTGKKVACDVTFLMTRGMDSRNRYILVVFACVRMAILSDPPRTSLMSVSSFNYTEGFAGSAPLAILEEILAENNVCENSRVHYCGRWLDKHCM